MIIQTMNDEEIYEEIRNDFDNLHNKILFCEGKFQASLNKAKRFPYVQSYPHTTRNRQNKYIITYTARGLYDINHPLVSVHCRYRDKAGEAAAAINWQQGLVVMYQNHFFKRYRDRVLKAPNKTIEETIEAFFEKEWSIFGIPITKELEDVFHCFEGHFSDDNVDILVCVEDGYAFGIRKENLFLMKTIITNEMLSDKQRALFQQLSQYHRTFNKQLY